MSATELDNDILPIKGVRLGTACAAIKTPERRDLVLVELEAGSNVAVVFTRNAFCAAPVTVAKAHIEKTAPRYLLVNTGGANAGTGQAGIEDARRCCDAVATLMGGEAEQVLPFSTGVIGERLPLEKIFQALPQCRDNLQADGWQDAAWGILTTDTVPKLVSRQIEIAAKTVTVTAMAKGSGMIRPDMATMLAYIATDAHIAPALLQRCLQDSVAQSFNRITVDGDTSTNDACLLIATGQGGASIRDDGEAYTLFQQTVEALCVDLAKRMIKDGEGATKLINIEVSGGRDEAECRQLAYTVAHSPLVKTAFFAADPNWGRILAAVGRAGLDELDVSAINIDLDEVGIVRQGDRDPAYSEEKGQAVMARDEITVHIELGRGGASTNVWTCDFSYDYVRINAEYRS